MPLTFHTGGTRTVTNDRMQPILLAHYITPPPTARPWPPASSKYSSLISPAFGRKHPHRRTFVFTLRTPSGRLFPSLSLALEYSRPYLSRHSDVTISKNPPQRLNHSSVCRNISSFAGDLLYAIYTRQTYVVQEMQHTLLGSPISARCLYSWAHGGVDCMWVNSCSSRTLQEVS